MADPMGGSGDRDRRDQDRKRQGGRQQSERGRSASPRNRPAANNGRQTRSPSHASARRGRSAFARSVSEYDGEGGDGDDAMTQDEEEDVTARLGRNGECFPNHDPNTLYTPSGPQDEPERFGQERHQRESRMRHELRISAQQTANTLRELVQVAPYVRHLDDAEEGGLDEETTTALRSLMMLSPVGVYLRETQETLDMGMKNLETIQKMFAHQTSTALLEVRAFMEENRRATANAVDVMRKEANTTLMDVRKHVDEAISGLGSTISKAARDAAEAATTAKAAASAVASIAATTRSNPAPAAPTPAAPQKPSRPARPATAAAAAAMPPTPAPAPATRPAARAPALNPTRPNHPCRLVIQPFHRVSDRTSLPPTHELVEDVNRILAASDDSKHLHVVAARWNEKANCVLMLRDDQKGADLLPFVSRFAKIIEPKDGRVAAHDAAKWYKLRVDDVRTHTRDGTALVTSETLLAEIRACNPVCRDIKIDMLPTFLRPKEMLVLQKTSSIVFGTSDESAFRAILRGRKYLALFGNMCSVSAFVERPGVQQCTKCWQYDHRTDKCFRPPTCRLCNSEEHDAAEHANQCTICEGMATDDDTRLPCTHDLLCASCSTDNIHKAHANHSATDSRCPVRLLRAGENRDRVKRGPTTSGGNANLPAGTRKKRAGATPKENSTTDTRSGSRFAPLEVDAMDQDDPRPAPTPAAAPRRKQKSKTVQDNANPPTGQAQSRPTPEMMEKLYADARLTPGFANMTQEELRVALLGILESEKAADPLYGPDLPSPA